MHPIRRFLWLPLIASAGLGLWMMAGAPQGRSCFTFVHQRGDAVFVGHNLDEAFDVLGMIVANPRGMAKENVLFGDLSWMGGGTGSKPRLSWTARYASLTYNMLGREFPDGGINEAGLYAGEMTLLATEWPEEGTQARLYHNQWIQYLLDNYATVEEALASLERALPEGNCKWHFLLADRSGNAAVVEFLQGKPVVYHEAGLPYPVLGNDAYQPELDDIKKYAGFGGTKKPEPKYEREDPRFRWAALMLSDDDPDVPPVDAAFSILERVDLGTTKWSIVCDLKAMRMWFKTDRSPKIKWVDFAAVEAACPAPPRAMDIHADAEGDAAGLFTPLSAEANRQAVQKAWRDVDAGFLGSIFFKPGIARNIPKAAEGFKCGP